MKHLNKNYKNSPLNKKIRYWYNLKQMINNSRMPDALKQEAMLHCDKEINRAWRLAYSGGKGYEIFS